MPIETYEFVTESPLAAADQVEVVDTSGNAVPAATSGRDVDIGQAWFATGAASTCTSRHSVCNHHGSDLAAPAATLAASSSGSGSGPARPGYG